MAKTARADFNGAFLRLCQPPPPRPPKFLLPLPRSSLPRRVNGAHSLLRSFIPPSFLFLYYIPVWREPAHCCCVKYEKKKKIIRWNFSVLRFLQFRQNFIFLYFYLFFLLKMLVIWIVIFLIVIHSLLLYFEKKFSKFPLANFPFPFSKRVKGHLGRYCFKGNCFFFPFYATIAAFVPFPLFRGMSGSFGTWRDIKREGGRLFRSNKFRANCKILFTGSPMYILHI